MAWLDRLVARTGSSRARFDGRHGRPVSGNGASSLHLRWVLPAGSWVGAEVTLEVVEPPTVAELYFWAMQVDLTDRGRPAGGAHLGLQWYPIHPGSTAVNWGGYDPAGRELAGSTSVLPSRPGNVNTRDFAWVPHRPYRLRVVAHRPTDRSFPTAWRGEVDDVVAGTTSVVRDLWAPGDGIGSVLVWSEVFAACDDPTTAVRWSDATLIGADGGRVPVRAADVNYQTLADGGCAVTDSSVDPSGTAWVQRTTTERRTPQGARLSLVPG